MGDLSAHFSRREFLCRHCGRIPPSYELAHVVQHLERLRSIVGVPIVVVGPSRCAQHPIERRKPGGCGEHCRTAVDLRAGVATERQARRAGFTGIGLAGKWAVHVDLGRRRRWRY